MHCPISFIPEDMIDIRRTMNRGIITSIHIADIHFSAIDPKIEFDILREQFINKIMTLNHIDIISVDGDLFDKKLMASNEAVYYASLFIDLLINICKAHKATLVLVHGTLSHDANQLKLFYHYLDDKDLDLRIVENIQFIYTHGAKILVIPELSGIDESVYETYLFKSGLYDMCFGHGTFEGAVYNNMTTGNSRLMRMKDFVMCRGPIIYGHVHTGGCFQKDFYYTGSPIRYKFGEEEAKHFLIVTMDLDSGYYYVDAEEITSFRYDTVELSDMISANPADIIGYINNLKSQGIDHLKVKFKYQIDDGNKTILNNYFRNNKEISLSFADAQEDAMNKALDEHKDDEYAFINDSKLSDEEKFVKFCNIKEGYKFITLDELHNLLTEEI